MSSRNRPRAAIPKDDYTDEVHLWSSIVERIRQCQALGDSYDEIAAKLPEAEADVSEDDPTAALAALEVLSQYHRECLKQSEAELKILTEEPDELMKNLETLISVRTAMEAETPQPRERHPAPAPAGKSGRNNKRKIEAVTNEPVAGSPAPSQQHDSFLGVSASGTATPNTRESRESRKAGRSSSVLSAAKSDSTGELDDVKRTQPSWPLLTIAVATSQPQKFAIGDEVFFRLKTKNKADDGEGIICTITSIIGEGKQRRYEVQDTEPDEGGLVAPPMRASVASLIPIPTSSQGLTALVKGKKYYARYPHTNTFYKADFVGMGRTPAGRNTSRLRFDGEEDGRESEVERRYVLEIR